MGTATASEPLASTAAASGDDPLGGGFRPDIEGLRAVAVLLVVAYHVGIPHIEGGYVGVDVFFVLSGYLITALLVAEFDGTGRIRFLAFYARRARRLLPAAFVVLAATLVLAWVVYPPFITAELAPAARATGAYLSNFWFAKHATDYFAVDRALNPWQHTWSLAVEEQFYLVWPTLLLGVLVVGRRIRRERAVLVVTMLAVITVSLGLSIVLTRRDPAWGFFGSPSRGWEFAVGALAMLVPALTRRRSALLAVAGLMAIVVSAVVFDNNTPFPGTAALLPALGTAAVLVAGRAGPRAGILGPVTTRPMLGIGRLSYSWYLWHWPLLVLANALYDPSLLGRVAVALLGLALSAATYLVVERRVRFSPYLRRHVPASLAVGVALTALMLLVSDDTIMRAKIAAAAAPQISYEKARKDWGSLHWSGRCIAPRLDPELRECSFGTGPTVVLFGDSHAAQWFGALHKVAQRRGWTIVTMIKSECPTPTMRLRHPDLGRDFSECSQWRAAALDRIAGLRPLAVVMANASYYPVTPSAWESGTGRTIELVPAATKAVVVADVLEPGFDPPICLAERDWSPSPPPTCSFRRAAASHPEKWAAERRAVARAPGAVVLDLNDAICRAAVCSVRQGAMIKYLDNGHLTETFSKALADELDHQLAAVGL